MYSTAQRVPALGDLVFMKSFHLHDDGFARELLSLPAPLAFIDFETFSAAPSPIPGTRTSDIIPCQWSCHTLSSHGLDWHGKISHDEFLWEGDWGWSPVYAFVESLYDAVRNARTILIYSQYEIRVLNLAKQLAENDMNALRNGEITDEFVVVDKNGDKVPLMSIAPKVAGWCDDIMARGRIYDMLGDSGSGVKYWLQSADFENSNSIKYVLPVAIDEYSGTSELLRYYNEPEDGYAGLRRIGNIAKGDECQSKYINALHRPQRSSASPKDAGAAPFDRNIERQCLVYCCLDTLSMVIIYLAVLEASERWNDVASNEYGWVRFADDNMIHKAYADGDRHAMVKVCSGEAYDEDTQFHVLTEAEVGNLPIREQYALICPRCRRAENGR